MSTWRGCCAGCGDWREAAWRGRLAAGDLDTPDWGTGCTCPPGCEYVEVVNEDLAHASACACGCDVA